jgi:hypothetical protein
MARRLLLSTEDMELWLAEDVIPIAVCRQPVQPVSINIDRGPDPSLVVLANNR